MAFKRLFWFIAVTTLFYGVLQPESASAETTIVPIATVTGRYDSNIFNRPKQLLRSGETTTSDFLTNVGGGVHVLHDTRDIRGDLTAAGTFHTYVEHSNRNFADVQVRGRADLSQWVEQYVRGAGLSIAENFRYTPEPPGFLVGTRDVQQEDDSLFHGTQGFRAPSFINSTILHAHYPLSRDIALEGGYIFALRHVGRIQGGDVPGINYFDTYSHTWFGGPRYKLTRNDSVAVLYRQTFALQQRSVDGGRTFGTNLISLAGNYRKEFQYWNLDVEGGITFVEPSGRSFPSGTIHVTTRPEEDTAVHLRVTRQARPSFFLQGGAIINHLATVGISHRIYERLAVDGMVGYTYNEYLPNTRGAFKNLTARGILHYKLTRNIGADFVYTYINIDNDATAVQYQISRHQVGIVLTAEWK